MGLVDYSDSESDSEVVPKPIDKGPAAAPSKKPFQKLVNRSGSSKIVVNLPTIDANAYSNSNASDEPPAKRARTAGSGASRFSNFGSFLPPPKKTTTTIGKSVSGTPATSSRTGGAAPAPGVHLKTGAEPAFFRGGATADQDGDEGANGSGLGFGSGLNLPPPKKAPSGPTIPDGQKPEEEVKLVGKPLMFKPLSVARKPGQKKKKDSLAGAPPGAKPSLPQKAVEPAPVAPPKKKISLFSMGGDEATNPPSTTSTSGNGSYEPLFTGVVEREKEDADLGHHYGDDYGDYDAASHGIYNNQAPPPNSQQRQPPQPQETLTSIADSLSLSKADRRELFGRDGPPNLSSSSSSTSRIINFNMEQEYAHNETLRQSGAIADLAHNPVRSIAPGKHSLRQMVDMVQNNQAALEDSFAAGKNNRRDAAGKYGWK